MTKKSGGSRDLTVRVKTARGRKRSSTKWLQRQLNDPYVQQAKRDGYRSRAAYKLIELDEKFKFLRPGQRVVDLGAAPGGWSQVALQHKAKQVIGIDLLEIDPVPGAVFIQKDFNDADAPDVLCGLLEGKADIVMSDMAANTTGHPSTDHIRIIALCELAYDFGLQILAPGGTFLCKVLKGGTENDLLTDMKKRFDVVRHAKPTASRKDSAESYVIATGFRG
jgi:23S rRNA (uridine2552-2'-O)-methyltransferase